MSNSFSQLLRARQGQVHEPGLSVSRPNGHRTKSALPGNRRRPGRLPASLAVLSTFFFATSIQAAIFNVNDLGDAVDAVIDGTCATASGACTLRAAIMEANSNSIVTVDVINLPAGTINLTINSGSSDLDPAVGDLDIANGGVTITGQGAGTTIVQAGAGFVHRIFEIPIDIYNTPTGSVTFEDFTIQGGNSSGLGVFNRGAAIQAGSRHPNPVRLRRMEITGNNGAAAVSSNAHLNIEDSTISGNTGHGVFFDADGNNFRSITVDGSTVDNNSVTGIAIGNATGGSITNSTISSNALNGLRAQYTGALMVTNSTIADNNSNTFGAGIAGIGYSSPLCFPTNFCTPDIRVRNSVVADNNGRDILTTAWDANAVLPTSNGYNLISDNTGAAVFTQTGDVNNTDPLLQPLALNAPGSTRTHALGAGSPAADTASASFAPATDQRGVSRPQGAGDDKGAYELQPLSADVAVTKDDGLASVNAGSTVTYTIVVSNAGPDAANGVTVADTLPAILSNASWTCAAAGGASCSASGNGDINDSVNLPTGGSATYTLQATLDLAATGTLSNTASATLPAGVTDPAPGNNSATDNSSIIAAPIADLSVTKTDGAFTILPGEQISYTIVVSNAGPATAGGAAVQDTLPGDLINASWTCATAGGASCSASGNGDINDTVSLPAGATATYTLIATVGAGASGTLANTATVGVPAGIVDTNLANNSATDTNTIGPPLAADAGMDRTTGAGAPVDPLTEPVTLGGAPTASGGTTPYTYLWTITGGVAGVDYELSSEIIADPKTVANPTFTGLTTGNYNASVTVSDADTQQTDDMDLDVVFPEIRDIESIELSGTGVTIGACDEINVTDTVILASADITFVSPLVVLLEGFRVESGATFTVVNEVPPECGF